MTTFRDQLYTNNYENTGCGVFKGGIQNQKDFWLKINCSQMKLLNFEKWSSDELSIKKNQKDSDDF